MNRRHLIKLLALSLGGLAMPLSWLRPLRADTLFDLLFGDVGLALHVGRRYLDDTPGAAARGRALVADLAAYETEAQQARLQQRVQAELAAQDVVVVDGWVLARSEAELCAAVHLDRSGA